MNIHIDSGIHDITVGDTQLELVNHDTAAAVLVQQFHLHGILVAYAEVFHFPRFLQSFECFCHLFRFHQRIRPVKEQDINIIRFKPFQAFIRRPEDMFFGKIIAGTRMYGTFGLKYHLLP